MILDTVVQCVASPTHQDLLMCFKSLNSEMVLIIGFLDVLSGLRQILRSLFQHLGKHVFRFQQTRQKVVEFDQGQQEVVE